MPVLELESYSFAFNDFIFGGTNSPYQILSVEGLEDLPAIRNQDDNRGYSDGMFTGRDFLSGRNLLITIQITGNSNYSMTQNVNTLQANLKPQQQGTGILQFQIPGSNLQRVNARVRRRSLRIDPDFTYGRSIAIYEFFAPDPRRYDDTLQTTDLVLGSLSTGRIYNRVYSATATPGGNPFETGMSFLGGAASANLIKNDGYVTTYPTITIYGPATNPVVYNVTDGAKLNINYTLVETDVLILDTDFRTVTLNGVSRRAILDNNSTWFGANSGTSYYTFTASGTTASTSCVVSWRSAYI
jgi:phage-related protein